MYAEFDPSAEVMVAVMEAPDAPRQPTGAPRTPGAPTLVLPLRNRWPDPYLPDLPQLLGPMVLDYQPDTQTLTQTFPAAQFSPEAVRTARLAQVDADAHDALARTDWAVLRLMETGKAIPEAVVARRAAVRMWHDRTRRALQQASPAELAATTWRLPEHLERDL